LSEGGAFDHGIFGSAPSAGEGATPRGGVYLLWYVFATFGLHDAAGWKNIVRIRHNPRGLSRGPGKAMWEIGKKTAWPAPQFEGFCFAIFKGKHFSHPPPALQNPTVSKGRFFFIILIL